MTVIYMEQTLAWFSQEFPERLQNLKLTVQVADSEEFRYFKVVEE